MGNCTNGHISKQITFDGETLRDDNTRRGAARGGMRRAESTTLRKRREKEHETHVECNKNAKNATKTRGKEGREGKEGSKGGGVEIARVFLHFS